jgi:hypothetical protein
VAYTRTLAQLKTSLLVRGQYENSADITPAVQLEVINDALVESHNLIVQRWDDYYTQISPQFVTTPSIDTYALPTDFEKLRKVELMLVSGASSQARWLRIYPISVDDQHRLTTIVAHRYKYRVAVVAGAASLILVPVPLVVETLRVFYIPHATQLANDPDVVVFDTPIEQKLVLQIALRDLYQRQDLPTQEIEGKIQILASQVRTAADHDAGEPFYLGSRTGDDEYY